MNLEDYMRKTPKPEAYLREMNYSGKEGTHYCSGCGHGIVCKVIGEVLDELVHPKTGRPLREDSLVIASVGCAVFDYHFYKCDRAQAPHGRATDYARLRKREDSDLVVFTHQGDGDLLGIGLGPTVETANRNEPITVFFVNNAIYGMTGGQMAPTTLEFQKSATSTQGRHAKYFGYPLRACELLTSQDNEGPAFIARTSVRNDSDVKTLKEYVRKAFRIQLKGLGFSLIELISPCPTNWGMTPKQAIEFIENDMLKVYPLGVFRDNEEKLEKKYGSRV